MTHLSIKGPFVHHFPIGSPFLFNQIGARTIFWSWVAKFLAKSVSLLVVFVVIGVHNKVSCLQPISEGRFIGDSFENNTGLVNADKGRTSIRSWIDRCEEFHNVGRRFRF